MWGRMRLVRETKKHLKVETPTDTRLEALQEKVAYKRKP